MKYKTVTYHSTDVVSEKMYQQLLDITTDVYDKASAEELARELDEKFPYGFVILMNEAETEVMAFGCCAKSALDFDVWEFAWAMVREKYRGMGFGKVLNDERIKIIEKLGGKKILCVSKKLWHLERSGLRKVCTFADNDVLMVCEI
ncbi:MAG: GNAT family N-acetyltransferase [Rickettsiales bacterium]|jgi:N-acetylglutamate synthase-like GNAT family acetyltransferase|nr:GNAT family N-acetyltransferase [Rickettsiales bacterium]